MAVSMMNDESVTANVKREKGDSGEGRMSEYSWH